MRATQTLANPRDSLTTYSSIVSSSVASEGNKNSIYLISYRLHIQVPLLHTYYHYPLCWGWRCHIPASHQNRWYSRRLWYSLCIPRTCHPLWWCLRIDSSSDWKVWRATVLMDPKWHHLQWKGSTIVRIIMFVTIKQAISCVHLLIRHMTGKQEFPLQLESQK